MNVAVVGGGIAGLVRARALLRRGLAVTLFEPRALGGVITTQHREGFTLEQGPNVLMNKAPLMRLIDELGLTDEVVYPSVDPYRQLVWWDGKPHDVPKSLAALIVTELLPAKAKWRLPLTLGRRHAVRIEEDDCSIGEIVEKLGGVEAAQRIALPAMKGVYGGNIYSLSARTLMPELFEALVRGDTPLSYFRHRSRRRIFVLRRGLSSLVEALWESMRTKVVHVRSEVLGVELAANLFKVSTPEGSRDFDAVHIATDRHPRLWSSGHDSIAALPDLSYSALLFAHVAVPHGAVSERAGGTNKGLPERAFGVLFPGERPSRLLGVMFNSQIFPHTAPDGESLCTVCLGGEDALGVIAEDDAVITNIISRELKELLGVARMRVLAIRRWPRAIPQLRVGHFRYVEELQRLERRFAGLFFCGADRGGIGIPDRVSIAADVHGVEGENFPFSEGTG